jgi:hypothetical protein
VARIPNTTEHAFFAQVVNPPGYVEPTCIITAIWLPSFMMQKPMQGYGHVPAPTMTFHIPSIMFCHGTVDPDSPCCYGAGRRDFCGELSSVDKDGVLDKGPRWGIFIYHYGHHTTNLVHSLVGCIIHAGILPLGNHYFGDEFDAPLGSRSHEAYCQRISEFLEGELKGPFHYLEHRCITIHVQDTWLEVNILPLYCAPSAPTELRELHGGLLSCPCFMVLDEVDSLEFRDAIGSVYLAPFFSSHGKNSRAHSEGTYALIPEESPVVCRGVESTYLESPPCVDHVVVPMYASPGITICTMDNLISSGYFSAYVVPGTPYSRLSMVCPSANSLGFSPTRIGSQGFCNPLVANTYAYSPHTIRNTALQPNAYAYYAQGISSSLLKRSKKLDPPLNTIGIGSDLRNWMPDTGASSHFTPCLSEMKEGEEGLDLGVEVTDGHIVQCTARGIVEINMIADDGLTFLTWSYLCSWSEGTFIFCNCLCQWR